MQTPQVNGSVDNGPSLGPGVLCEILPLGGTD